MEDPGDVVGDGGHRHSHHRRNVLVPFCVHAEGAAGRPAWTMLCASTSADASLAQFAAAAYTDRVPDMARLLGQAVYSTSEAVVLEAETLVPATRRLLCLLWLGARGDIASPDMLREVAAVWEDPRFPVSRLQACVVPPANTTMCTLIRLLQTPHEPQHHFPWWSMGGDGSPVGATAMRWLRRTLASCAKRKARQAAACVDLGGLEPDIDGGVLTMTGVLDVALGLAWMCLTSKRPRWEEVFGARTADCPPALRQLWAAALDKPDTTSFEVADQDLRATFLGCPDLIPATSVRIAAGVLGAGVDRPMADESGLFLAVLPVWDALIRACVACGDHETGRALSNVFQKLAETPRTQNTNLLFSVHLVCVAAATLRVCGWEDARTSSTAASWLPWAGPESESVFASSGASSHAGTGADSDVTAAPHTPPLCYPYRPIPLCDGVLDSTLSLPSWYAAFQRWIAVDVPGLCAELSSTERLAMESRLQVLSMCMARASALWNSGTVVVMTPCDAAPAIPFEK